MVGRSVPVFARDDSVKRNVRAGLKTTRYLVAVMPRAVGARILLDVRRLELVRRRTCEPGHSDELLTIVALGFIAFGWSRILSAF
jgi:hypothetical protein